MSVNIEIKARVKDPESLEAKASALADGDPELLHQEDTFFHCAEGRLKLRVENGKEGHLIQYQRTDTKEPKPSHYRLVPVEAPSVLKAALTDALGVKVVVAKKRTLYMAGRTRIHLDRVEGLGDFMELEVVLNENDSREQGHQEAEELMAALGIREGDLVSGAYADLLAEKEGGNSAAQASSSHHEPRLKGHGL